MSCVRQVSTLVQIFAHLSFAYKIFFSHQGKVFILGVLMFAQARVYYYYYYYFFFSILQSNFKSQMTMVTDMVVAIVAIDACIRSIPRGHRISQLKSN